MSKENAERFYALYQQHQAIAKRLAALNVKTEDGLLEGLVKMAQEVGLQFTVEELREQRPKHPGVGLEEEAGGWVGDARTHFGASCVRGLDLCGRSISGPCWGG